MLSERFTRRFDDGSPVAPLALRRGPADALPCRCERRAAKSAQGEIDHLLDFVGTSTCTFVRNGTDYPPPKARDASGMKYQFARRGSRAAEEFIKYLATESSMSGEPIT